MAMTLRLTDEETAALRARAEADGTSMHETARRAIRAFVDDQEHRELILDAVREGMSLYEEALERLGR